MGDVMTLVERAEELYEQDEAEELSERLMRDEFTLQDYLDQLQKIRQMGPLTQIMGMIPGMSKMMQQVDPQDAEQRIKKVEAIIQSMTPYERAKPKKLNASRKKRIARGSGTDVRDVNDLIKQYRTMRKMMKQMRKSGFQNIPGLGNLTGGGGRGGFPF
jgi:signal recognition particle subunit SRP54